MIFILYLSIFFFFLYIDIYIHEAGHVIAGKMMKIGISKVIIGSGKELFEKRILGIPVIITRSLLGGVTFVGKMDRRLLKLRFLFFTAGGILLQTVLAAVLILLIKTERLDFIYTSFADIINLFIISNIFLIVINLFPMNSKFKGVSIANDGLELLKIPFYKDKEINKLLCIGQILEADELLRNKKYELAAKAYKEGLKEYSSMTYAKINLSFALLKLLDFEEAENILLSALRDENNDKEPNVFVYNNLACVYLYYHNYRSLKLADKYSKLAFELNPDIPSVRSTRGSVLIACGEYDAGIDLLLQITSLKKPVDQKRNVPCNIFFIAYGYFMKCDIEKGNEYLKKVKDHYSGMDPDQRYICELLNKKRGTPFMTG